MRFLLPTFLIILIFKEILPIQNLKLNSPQPIINPDLVTSFLDGHNQLRKAINGSPLIWNDSLAFTAQDFASGLAANSVFGYSGIPDIGENKYFGPAGKLTISEILQQVWGSEKQFYNADDMFPYISSTGNWIDVANYSQMVWSNTISVGCSFITGADYDYTICHYYPKGNMFETVPRIPYRYVPASDERSNLGLNTFQWDITLAYSAQKHAEFLAKNHIFEHSNNNNSNIGENLWSGPAKVSTVDDMVNIWLNERRYFQNSLFPRTSVTGNWHNTSNYSQLVWASTTNAGCGLATSDSIDYFVCHFYPSGNIPRYLPIEVEFKDSITTGWRADPLVIPSIPSGDPIADAVDAHDQIRMKYDPWTYPSWDDSWAKSAQQYAEYLAKNNIFEHSGNLAIGENLWSGPKGTFTVYQIIEEWYDQYRSALANSLSTLSSTSLDYPFGGWNRTANHSQMIYYFTTAWGCGMASNDAKDYYVCHYDMPWRRGAQCKPKPFDLVKDSLIAHNQFRMENFLNNLTWDQELAASAQRHADYVAEIGVLKYSGNISIGENVLLSKLSVFSSICMMVDFWVGGNYDGGQGGASDVEQLMWPDMTRVGCGIVSGSVNVVYVCHYNSPWSVDAQYRFREQDLKEILTIHNEARLEALSRIKVANSRTQLNWDDECRYSAQNQANYLAHNNIFEHNKDPYYSYRFGENLWWGPVGVFNLSEMIQVWLDEKQYFIDGVFPNVSKTGNWSDVANYTQIIWGETGGVGCGFATSETHDYLVCHYNGRGNVDGLPPISTPTVYDYTTIFNSIRREYYLEMLQQHDDFETSYVLIDKVVDYFVREDVSMPVDTQKYGQNVWKGAAGFFTLEQIAQLWFQERELYNNGIFPNVSTTGNWGDVANFTQLIWADTVYVTCEFRRVMPFDYLVCLFSPPGNIVGQNPIDGVDTLSVVN